MSRGEGGNLCGAALARLVRTPNGLLNTIVLDLRGKGGKRALGGCAGVRGVH